MLHTTQGIVLHNVKYSDKRIISKIYTKDFGLLRLNITVGNAPKSKIKAGIIQPLSQLEFILSIKENKEVHQLVEAKSIYSYQHLSTDFYKLCIAQFINEVLYRCLKEQTRNEELYEFVTNIFQWLDSNDKNFSDLHLYFLFAFSKYLGFYPLNNYSPANKYFDAREGQYHSYSQSFPLSFDEKQSRLFLQLFSFSLNDHQPFNRMDRLDLLECLMVYYKFHIPGLNEFKSFNVLQETLNT